jgi:hypothetical protein
LGKPKLTQIEKRVLKGYEGERGFLSSEYAAERLQEQGISINPEKVREVSKQLVKKGLLASGGSDTYRME